MRTDLARCFSPHLALLTLALASACSLTPPADVNPTVTLAQLWAGNAHFVSDPEFDFPPVKYDTGGQTFAENSTFYHNGTFYAYYREESSFVFRIALATSTDGDNFTRVGSVIQGSVGSPATYNAYAPGAFYRPGSSKVFMVYEAKNSSQNHLDVYLADATNSFTSFTKRGVLLSNSQGLPYNWENGNVGTPTLNFYLDRWFVWYHGWSGVDSAPSLYRGFAMNFEAGESLSASTLTRFQNPALFPGPSGEWDDVGIGRGDIVSDGTYLYMVYEGATGTATCSPNGKYGWGIARSKDFVTWTKFSGNPIMQSTQKCGVSMPEWFWDPVRSKLGVIYTGQNGGFFRVWLESNAVAGGIAQEPDDGRPVVLLDGEPFLP